MLLTADEAPYNLSVISGRKDLGIVAENFGPLPASGQAPRPELPVCVHGAWHFYD
jgi:hypothetical protein